MKRLILIIALFTNSLFVFADIIPNPIQVKGIIPGKPVNIQMVSETVQVSLYKDSSVVECTFYMKNLGKAADVEVGFPVMNFYHWQRINSDTAGKDKFDVWINNIRLHKTDIYIPKELENLLPEQGQPGNLEKLSQLSRYENENKPWYIWQTKFNKKETIEIVVKYSLPVGTNKTNRFFNYLLSTGAGWKGKIKQADVIVTLKDFPAEQLIKVSPAGYVQKENQLIWNFRNLEPTINDDILIDFEAEQGSYKKQLEKLNSRKILYYVDGKEADFNKHATNPATIASIDVRKSTSSTTDTVFIYTKDFTLKTSLNKIAVKFPKVSRQLSRKSVKEIEEKYSIGVNGEEISKQQLWSHLTGIKTNEIEAIKITKKGRHKRQISIVTISR